jgi:hypothetical protein
MAENWLFQAMRSQVTWSPPFTAGSLEGKGSLTAFSVSDAFGASGSDTLPTSTASPTAFGLPWYHRTLIIAAATTTAMMRNFPAGFNLTDIVLSFKIVIDFFVSVRAWMWLAV